MATVEIKGIEEKRKQLDRMLSTDPYMRKRLQGCIRTILAEARKHLSEDAQSGLGMKSDPRKAYKAVRSAVYKRILGGQVNILQSKRAKSSGHYTPQRKGLPKRGGNRMTRSPRTEAVDGYEGSARGFILRFLNQGTKDRYAGYGRNGRTEAEQQRFVTAHKGKGNRGHITARNWFGQASQHELEAASSNIEAIIDRILNNEFK